MTTCPVCGQATFLRPDYPGGLYIADAVVSEDFKTSNYAGVIGEGPLDFDDNLDDRLRRLVVAGRLADAGDRVNAALEAAAAHEISSATPASNLRCKILGRLIPTFAKMTGSEFHRFVLGLPVVSDNLIRADLHGFPKIWDEAKVTNTVQGCLEASKPNGYFTNITVTKSSISGQITCKLYCSEQLARWLADCKNKSQELGLPWTNVSVYPRR